MKSNIMAAGQRISGPFQTYVRDSLFSYELRSQIRDLHERRHS